MIDFLNFEDTISDEMLAAYIDGNATPEENAIIQNALGSDESLAEVIDVVHDSIPFANGDWEISNLELGTFDLGMSPIASFADLAAMDSPLLGTDNELDDDFGLGIAASADNPTTEDDSLYDNSSSQSGEMDNCQDFDNTIDIQTY